MFSIENANGQKGSFAEVRLLVLASAAGLFALVSIPAFVVAADLNGDNLDDAWEAQYGITTNAYAATNLVGWWQMEPNATNAIVDSSGHGSTGSLVGFSSNAFTNGLFGSALSFPPQGAVPFATNGALGSAANQFTFSTWFQSTNAAPATATIATWCGANTNSWSIGTINGSAKAVFSGSTGQQAVSTANAVQLYDGAWHQLALSYTTSKVATLYVDGQSNGASSITNWAPGTLGSFGLGVPNTFSTNEPFELDDTRLYNRALGPDEIVQLPVTYTDLNGSGLTVYDDYLEGLDPLATDSLVTPGFIDSGLVDYYGSTQPSLAVTSGNGQTVPQNSFSADALTVQVTGIDGSPLANAPITFTIAPNSGGTLAQASGLTTYNTISLTTDANGFASIYFKAGSSTLQDCYVNAIAVTPTGKIAVQFTVYCGEQSGLSLWLKADSGVTTDTNHNVTGWVDQSPSGNNATAVEGSSVSVSATGLTGNAALHFAGAGCLTINDASSLRPANITILAVAKENSTSLYQTLMSRGYENTSSLTPPYISWDACLFGVNSDNYLRSSITTGGNQTQNNVSNTYDMTQPHIAVWKYDGSSQQLFLAGSLQASTATSGPIDYGGGPASISIGALLDQDSPQVLNADVSEILVYDHSLSSQDQAQVEGYLADKYGLFDTNASWPLSYSSDIQALIAANGWNQDQAQQYIAFTATNPPVVSNGLSLWLKADAGVTTDGNGNVLRWNDQSPCGNNASAVPGSTVSVLAMGIEGSPALHFGGSGSLTIPDALALRPANITVLAVAKENSTSTYQTLISRGYQNTSSLTWPYVSWDFCLFGVNSGNYLRSAISTGGNLTENDAPNSYDLTKAHVSTWRYDGSSQQVFLA